MEMRKPNLRDLPSYLSALEAGWLPTTGRPEAARTEIDAIAKDPETFVARLDDPEAKGAPVTLPDGSQVPRLPSRRWWIWKESFCGHISLRWSPGTEALPPTCLGHIGYGVVPWRRGEGLATAALIACLPEAEAIGLRYVEVTTRVDNPASARVIEKAGGQVVEEFEAPAAIGGHRTLRFTIALA